MRLRFVPLFLILLCPAFVAAQVTQLWVARYHGPVPVSNDSAGFIAVDNNTDQVYVAGASQGTGGSEYALVSYDPCGNQLWVARNAGSVGGLAVDSNLGRVYVSSSAGIVAYDSAGNQLWIASYSGGNGGRIAVDGNTGNVYMIGAGQLGTVPAAAVIAFDSDGNQLWTTLYAPPRTNSNGFADIAVDDISGNVYVTGTSHFPIPSTYCMEEVAYNDIGTQLWTAAACSGGFVPVNIGVAITVDSNGNIYATGQYHNDFAPFWEYHTLAFDPTGQRLWEAFYVPAQGVRSPAGIATDNVNGNVYVTGGWGTVAYNSGGGQLWTNSFTASRLAVDSTTGNVYVINTVPATGTGSDYDTVAYDSTGNQLWMAHYHGPVAGGFDSISAIGLDSNLGNVYVTGTSQATATSSDFATVAYSQASNAIPAVTTATPRIVDPTRRKAKLECGSCGCQLR